MLEGDGCTLELAGVVVSGNGLFLPLCGSCSRLVQQAHYEIVFDILNKTLLFFLKTVKV